jgi:hypothetical protein
MSKPPIFRRIVREDIPEAPDWIEIVIYSLNQFYDTVRAALTRSLTFTENHDAQIFKFRIVAGASATDNTYRFAITMKKKVDGMLLAKVEQVENTYTPLTSVPWVDWHQESTEMVIDSIQGLTSAKSYDITLFLF